MDDPQTDDPIPTGGRLSDVGSPLASMVAEADRALKAVEPTAFLVVPRVLRRVMKQVWDLPALTVNVPHRKTWIVRRSILLRHVDWDELGLEPFSELPEKSILIARPDDKHLESISLSNLKLLIWRLLFHARVHRAFDELRDSGQLDASAFRQRIHRLGQVEFDEIRSVLRRENFTHGESSQAEIYIEFAALYCELKYFSPHCLNSYFPSFEDYEVVDRLLGEDLDVPSLFTVTRLDGAPDPISAEAANLEDETDQELDSLTGHHSPHISEQLPPVDETDDGFPDLVESIVAELPMASRPSRSAYARQERKAEKAFNRGNAVGAALFLMRAARYAPPELVDRAVTGALQDIKRLVRRLQEALEFDDVAARSWYEALVRLLVYSTSGFWNADKRLLYDLQKVCVDHEREIFTVDLVPWITSFGRRPIRRPLPNQREVLMSKHLRSATRRLVSSRLTGAERRDLSHLLHDAAHSAEGQMRQRLRPLTHEALTEVGFVPESMPERVAFQKMNEELLDGVANRGFLTMGDLRDANSRCNMKLNDLSGPSEFLFGDRLLRADRVLNRALDGVYQRGDFYLHWLQRLSALAFGTALGRFATRYIAIPYGGAFLCFEAVIHVVKIFDRPPKDEAESLTDETASGTTDNPPPEPAAPDSGPETVSTDAVADTVQTVHVPTPLDEWISHYGHSVIFALGTFILLVIYSAPFRRYVSRIFKTLFSGLRQLFYEWPMRVLRKPAVRQFLRSAPVTMLRKFVLWPMIPTTIICIGLPQLFEALPSRDATYWGVVWAAMSVILNSRVGRDVEELSAEWAFRTWNRIRVHIFVALFELVMESFKKLLEWFERVLYAVDEWLRFKSGETTVSLAVKAVLGVFWSAFTFVARFCVNLLIEPQINPIKHFPVVTVSHKLLLPLTGTFADLLTPLVRGETELAYAIVGPVIFVIPGVFGFIAWELKSNWLLYRSNRGEQLQPVLVGSHGETFIRLMKPGFHSGTLPKLFVKLRRTDRRRDPAQHSLARSKYLDQLHHVHLAVEHFVDRELLALLRESSDWTLNDVEVERIRLASNNIRIELICPSLGDDRLILVFEEQSGWLVANAQQSGWVTKLSTADRRLLMTALIGFYRLAGVDLVREQIDVALGRDDLPYDVNEDGIIVWPESHYDEDATYSLRYATSIRPYPRAVARTYGLPDIPAERLMFVRSELHWTEWDAQWDGEQEERASVMPENSRWDWSGP